MSVNEKSTKKQILDAYQESLAAIKQLKAGQLDPQAEKAKARSKELKELTNTDKVDDTLEELLTLSSRVPDYIGSAVEQIRGYSKKANELKEVIEFQEQTLQELYGVENSAETLAAMIETKHKVRADLDESIEDVKKNWAKEREEQEERHARESEDAERAHSRRIAEWEYEFLRRTKQKEDGLKDELQATRKEFDLDTEKRQKDINEQVEALQKREETMDEIETKLTEMEQELVRVKEARALEIETVKEEAKAKAKTSYAIEVNALKKTHEAEVSILAAKSENLEQQLMSEREDNGALSAKLDEAYTKIQDVAVKSLESQGNARMVEMSRSMASDQRPSKN